MNSVVLSKEECEILVDIIDSVLDTITVDVDIKLMGEMKQTYMKIGGEKHV